MWGARGTGKWALVKSAVAHVQAAGGALALIEVVTHRLDDLSALFDAIAPVDRAFALFIDDLGFDAARSEEHTSELQSLMRISYAVFCLKKKKQCRRTRKKIIICRILLSDNTIDQ